MPLHSKQLATHQAFELVLDGLADNTGIDVAYDIASGRVSFLLSLMI